MAVSLKPLPFGIFFLTFVTGCGQNTGSVPLDYGITLRRPPPPVSPPENGGSKVSLNLLSNNEPSIVLKEKGFYNPKGLTSGGWGIGRFGTKPKWDFVLAVSSPNETNPKFTFELENGLYVIREGAKPDGEILLTWRFLHP